MSKRTLGSALDELNGLVRKHKNIEDALDILCGKYPPHLFPQFAERYKRPSVVALLAEWREVGAEINRLRAIEIEVPDA